MVEVNGRYSSVRDATDTDLPSHDFIFEMLKVLW